MCVTVCIPSFTNQNEPTSQGFGMPNRRRAAHRRMCRHVTLYKIADVSHLPQALRLVLTNPFRAQFTSSSILCLFSFPRNSYHVHETVIKTHHHAKLVKHHLPAAAQSHAGLKASTLSTLRRRDTSNCAGVRCLQEMTVQAKHSGSILLCGRRPHLTCCLKCLP